MICRFRTKNDINGNARVLWVVTVHCQGWLDGLPVIRPRNLPMIIKDEHGNRPDLIQLIIDATGAQPLEIEVTPKEYQRLVKQSKFWTDSDIKHSEKDWVKK